MSRPVYALRQSGHLLFVSRDLKAAKRHAKETYGVGLAWKTTQWCVWTMPGGYSISREEWAAVRQSLSKTSATQPPTETQNVAPEPAQGRGRALRIVR
jgi:hypothetical protein